MQSSCMHFTCIIRFQDVIERDSAIQNSPYFVCDTIMRVIAQNRGRNHRSAIFTHDVWLMIMNYPNECWNLDTIVTSFAQCGRLLVWNRDASNRSRILIKVRVHDIDKIPMSMVVLQNSSEEGDTCQTYL